MNKGKGSNVKYKSKRFYTSLMRPIRWDVNVGASLSYLTRDYDNLNTTALKKQGDSEASLGLSLNRFFLKKYRGNLAYQYSHSNSNISSLDFDNKTIQLSFEYFF